MKVRDQRDTRFEDLYNRHRSAVWLYCRRRVGQDRAYDVMGEVFLVVWRRIDSAPPGPDALPWLYRICHLTLSNQWRGAARRLRLESKLYGIGVTQPIPLIDHVVAREEVRNVLHLLEGMRASDAEILKLAAWEGLDSGEIATVLDISPVTARQRLSRARRRLSNLYEKTYNETQTVGNPVAQKGDTW
jgi:RNA polymerase sigma-70 factor (ECF subfamily)